MTEIIPETSRCALRSWRPAKPEDFAIPYEPRRVCVRLDGRDHSVLLMRCLGASFVRLGPDEESRKMCVGFEVDGFRNWYPMEKVELIESINGVRIGDYVLATKYHDGDACDDFTVGYVTGFKRHNRFVVSDEKGYGLPIVAGVFSRAERITLDEGSRLVDEHPKLSDKPGSSLWWYLSVLRQSR